MSVFATPTPHTVLKIVDINGGILVHDHLADDDGEVVVRAGQVLECSTHGLLECRHTELLIAALAVIGEALDYPGPVIRRLGSNALATLYTRHTLDPAWTAPVWGEPS